MYCYEFYNKPYLSLKSQITSNFLRIPTKFESSSSLKAFCKTDVIEIRICRYGSAICHTNSMCHFNKYSSLIALTIHVQKVCTILVPTDKASCTMSLRSFVPGPFSAFSAITNADKTSSLLSLYFLSDVIRF